MCLGEGDQGASRLDPALGFGDRLGPWTHRHRVERRLSRLLLVLSGLKCLLGVKELLLRRKARTRQRAETIDYGLGALDCDPRLLDRQLANPAFLSAGE